MSTTIAVFLIRHTPSGAFIPQVFGRGGSYYEPAAHTEKPPRIFFSHHAARSFLGQWLRGKHSEDRKPDYEGNIDGAIEVEPVPTRIRAEMEIIERSIAL